MKMKWLYSPTALLTLVAIAITGYTAFQVMGYGSKGNGDNNIVVVDMLKVEMAQRIYVATILKREIGVSGIASAFKASGDIIASSKVVAPGYNIAVKQAFIHSNYPDITDRVIKEMGLPEITDEKTEMMLDNEGTIGDLGMNDLSGTTNGVEDENMRSSKLMLPY